MLDPTPIIIEATKFLFKEAGKWLEKLREQGHIPPGHAPKRNLPATSPLLTASEFDSLMGTPELLTSTMRPHLDDTDLYEIRSLVSQLQLHRRSMADYENSIAELGAIAPPALKRGFEREARDFIEKSDRLRDLLERTYGRRIELASDEPQ